MKITEQKVNHKIVDIVFDSHDIDLFESLGMFCDREWISELKVCDANGELVEIRRYTFLTEDDE